MQIMFLKILLNNNNKDLILNEKNLIYNNKLELKIDYKVMKIINFDFYKKIIISYNYIFFY